MLPIKTLAGYTLFIFNRYNWVKSKSVFTFELLNASSVHIIEGNMSTWIIKLYTDIHTNTHTFGKKVHIFTGMIMTIVIIIVTISFFTKIRFPRRIKAEIHIIILILLATTITIRSNYSKGGFSLSLLFFKYHFYRKLEKFSIISICYIHV